MVTHQGHSHRVAAPYARAAFDYALKHNALAAWSKSLACLASLASDQAFQQVLSHPLVSVSSIADLCLKAAKVKASEPFGRFVVSLSKHKRFDCLQALSELFESYRHAHEGVMPVHVKSRYPVDKATEKKLSEKIEASYQKKPLFHYDLDETVLGGLIYTVGDRVYDCSVQGWLARLRSHLKG